MRQRTAWWFYHLYCGAILVRSVDRRYRQWAGILSSYLEELAEAFDGLFSLLLGSVEAFFLSFGRLYNFGASLQSPHFSSNRYSTATTFAGQRRCDS